ncbi:MAG: hypothetical protein J6K84_03935 [Oscillospiraceae bacterium]|nr:hypothetical protein [Oscillospiraceae bacterium]
MKKSSFVALILGTVSGVLFSLGMCMALLPEWNAFREGIIFGALGLVLGLVTLLIWRKMEHKAPVKFSFRQVAVALMGIVGALTLGLGMCFCMVWAKMVLGIVIGLAGIVILLSIIPVVKGLK